MKNLNKFKNNLIAILVLLFVSSFVSCKKVDPLEKYNKDPLVTIKKIDLNGELTGDQSNNIQDSVKLENEYKLRFFIKDEEKIKLGFDCLSEHKDYTLTIDQGETDTTGLITFKANAPGNFEFHFKAIDQFEKYGKAVLKLNSFSNITPIAKMQVTKLTEHSPYELKIDASQSYDPDKNYGGGIVKYLFEIGDEYEVETTQNTIRYILPGPGTRNVKVSVKDNQGAWSNPEIQQVVF